MQNEDTDHCALFILHALFSLSDSVRFPDGQNVVQLANPFIRLWEINSFGSKGDVQLFDDAIAESDTLSEDSYKNSAEMVQLHVFRLAFSLYLLLVESFSFVYPK